MSWSSGICSARRFLLLLTFSILPGAAQAQFFLGTNNNAITIFGYDGPGGAVVIPATTNGLPVTGIGNFAFAQSPGLTSITIPDSVTNIGQQAFESCAGLTNVTIDGSIAKIGSFAFHNCTNLANVAIAGSASSIEGGAFAGCGGLTSVVIPGVSSISGGAFEDCTNLTSVTIPDGVTNIGGSAFSGCIHLTNMTVEAENLYYSCMNGVLLDHGQTTLVEFPACFSGSYTIPDGITSIGDAAFYSCSGVSSVTISASVTNIGEGAFRACTRLTAITMDATNLYYSTLNGVLFDKNQMTLIQYPGGATGNYSIPGTVTEVGAEAFESCAGLANVVIPAGVTDIGEAAFTGCTGLTRVAIPGGVTSIADVTFYECSGLTNVTIPRSVTNIGQGAFDDCRDLTGVYFQGNAPVPTTDTSVFYFDTNATVYYLPGTTNWGATFDGRPTVLWNPQAQASDPTFGVRTNKFGFNITGTSNLVIVVVAATDLTNPVWLPVSTNTLVNGSSYFSDPIWSNLPSRYYRFRSP